MPVTLERAKGSALVEARIHRGSELADHNRVVLNELEDIMVWNLVEGNQLSTSEGGKQKLASTLDGFGKLLAGTEELPLVEDGEAVFTWISIVVNTIAKTAISIGGDAGVAGWVQSDLRSTSL